MQHSGPKPMQTQHFCLQFFAENIIRISMNLVEYLKTLVYCGGRWSQKYPTL